MAHSFIVKRSNGTVTEHPTTTPKVKYYTDEKALQEDLANLSEGQVVATPSSQEVDSLTALQEQLNKLVPIGTIFSGMYSTAPDGYLLCDGATFDQIVYPELYEVLGTNVLPDLRECVLVGVGQNSTDSIAAHDVYTLNQFKDDQLQSHTHTLTTIGLRTGQGTSTNTGNTYWSPPESVTVNANNGRSGTTTHGKQKGVNFVIKATV